MAIRARMIRINPTIARTLERLLGMDAGFISAGGGLAFFSGAFRGAAPGAVFIPSRTMV
jgi:hypothetical protein